MVKRIYIDTSIIGGYFDKEFKEITRALFHRLISREIIFVISDLLELELNDAPKNVKRLLLEFPDYCFERIELTHDAFSLADKYVEEKVVGKTSIEDCRHIALATVNKVDVLITHVTQKGKIRHEDSKAQWFHQEKHKLCEDFVSLCLSG